MLRSFDYAAHHALGDILGAPPGVPSSRDLRGTRMTRRASAWAVHSRRAFCAGYTAAGGQDPRTSPVLLRAFEADKAVYEALYEARNRPEWLPIPLAAVRRLAHGSRFVG
jgi:maltokinase